MASCSNGTFCSKRFIMGLVLQYFLILAVISSQAYGSQYPNYIMTYSTSVEESDAGEPSIHLIEKRETDIDAMPDEKYQKSTPVPKKATFFKTEASGPTKPPNTKSTTTSSETTTTTTTSDPFFSDDIPFNMTFPPNITANKTDYHLYYNSTFYTDPEKAMSFWVDFDKLPKSHVTVHEMLSTSHRRAASVSLSFDFPFYGHLLRNITIATGGFLYTGEHMHSWLAATQYVSPLMANFDTSLNNDSVIQYADNGTAFTVYWKDVSLQDRPNDGNFSFQVTLLKNGDIVFVYKKVPIPVQDINFYAHPVKVGLSDAYVVDRIVYFLRRKTIYEYHRVEFRKEEIANQTAIYFTALPTCLGLKSCNECVSADIGFRCRWCESAQRCSDGLDRHRQNWFNLLCDKLDPLPANESMCTAPPPSTTSYATASVLETNASDATSHTMVPSSSSIPASTAVYDVLTTPNASDSGSSSISGSIVPASKMAGQLPSNQEAAVHDAIVDKKEKEEGSHRMSAGGIVALLLVVSIVTGVGLWIVYAYHNPQSPSGQLLIRYRPSRWHWKHGEARYTAASSIHI